MLRWFHNLKRLWSGSEWFYITKIERGYEIDCDRDGLDTLGKSYEVTTYYAECNTSARPQWYHQKGRADTVHKSRVRAILKDLNLEWPEDEIRLWTKEEF